MSEISSFNIYLYFSLLTLFSIYGPEKFFDEFWSPLIVHSPSGLVQGAREKGHQAFYGIPYALPPTGERRFRSPEPYPTPWKRTLQAGRSYPPACPQQLRSYFKSLLWDVEGNEDCLYLNIFSPDSASLQLSNESPPSQENLFPVMVWIHGGNFMSGTASDYESIYFMTKDIILVMISYRLGPLGFLNLGEEYARGNQGIEDQILALSWIQDNISSFGGDPQRVTIFGESSGAISVLHHMSVPMSKLLFQSAIIQSGSIYQPTIKETFMMEMHEAWIAEMGCIGVIDTQECIQKLPLAKIVNKNPFLSDCNLKKNGHPFPNPWFPVLEGSYLLKEVSAENKKSHAPRVMIGTTSNEGFLATSRFMLQNNYTEGFMSKWEECFKLNTAGDESYDLEPVMDYYFGSNKKPDFPSQVQNFSNLISDFWYNGPTFETVKEIANKGSPVYYYLYDHDGFLSMTDSLSRASYDYWKFIVRYAFGQESGKTNGASHADELPFLFREYPRNLLKRPVDEKMWRLMIDVWTNFATSGDPNGAKEGYNWKLVSHKNDYTYIVLKNGEIKFPSHGQMKEQRDRLKVWDSAIIKKRIIIK
uniref:Carboxylic ester hydrolase n=1 Tax=Lepeophtheirus salmonis TaxID=72036 RepID=A0A7R8SEA0_LEPSM